VYECARSSACVLLTIWVDASPKEAYLDTALAEGIAAAEVGLEGGEWESAGHLGVDQLGDLPVQERPQFVLPVRPIRELACSRPPLMR